MPITLEAPLYPPADAFAPPEMLPTTLGVDSVSLRELLELPQTRAILFEEAPELKAASSAPNFQPHLGNFTVRGAMKDGMVSEGALMRIAARFSALPLLALPPQ